MDELHLSTCSPHLLTLDPILFKANVKIVLKSLLFVREPALVTLLITSENPFISDNTQLKKKTT